MRANAAESLGFFPKEGSETTVALIEKLGDEKVEVRRAAILSLGRIGKGLPDVEEKIKQFSNDPDGQTKLAATISLSALGKIDDSTLPTLIEALGHKDEPTAKAAGRVVSTIAIESPDKVMPGLKKLLEKKDSTGTLNALRVLRQMKGSAASILPLVASLYDKASPPERFEILDTVTAIDTQGDYALPLLLKGLKEKDALDRKEALLGLMRFRAKPDQIMDALIGALDDADLENRLLAMGILRGMGDSSAKAVPKLISLMDDKDVRIKNAAIGSLSSYKEISPEALAALEKALKDPDNRVRIAVIGGLRRVGTVHPDKAAPILLAALDVEKNDATKRAIISALDSMKSAMDKK